MKYCPQCNLDYEDETVFCSADGSRLQMRAPRVAPRAPGGGLGVMGGGGLGAAVLSSQPITALGATALQVPTPPRGVPAPRPVSGLPDEQAETMRPPSARFVATAYAQGEDGSRDTMSPEPRAPAISREMRAQGATAADNGQGDLLNDMPTIAMKSPVAAAQQTTEDGERNLVGTVIAGRYKVLRRLGEGGMGVVYEAVDERLEKHVAVKVLREDFARRQDVVARFTQEAKSAARIKHENVLDVTDYGQTDDGSFFIAMELLRGTDLADVLQGEGVISQERGIEVAIQVCRALQAAHARGIVHRDMKPENVFLVRTDDGRELVKIVDFGIAQMKDISGSAEGSRKLTRTGMIFGTPEYMSPEQAAGKPVDHRVDVYAAGVILYEMFTGRVPFVGDTFMGILTKHMFEQPPAIHQVNPAAQVSPDLESVIFKALAKDPNQRFQSMQEFADDLQRFRQGARPNAAFSQPSAPVIPPTAAQVLGVQSSPGVPLSQIPGYSPSPLPAVPSHTVESELTPPRRRPVLFIAFIALALVVGGVAVAVALSHDDPPPAAPTPTPAPPAAQPPATAQRPAGTVTAPVPTPPPTPTARPTPPVAPLPPPPRMVRVQVSPDGALAHASVTFAYADNVAGRAAIEPCAEADDCVRSVVADAPLRVTAQGRRGTFTVTATATRDDEVIRLSSRAPSPLAQPARPTSPTPRPATQTSGHGEVPCGELDPRTGLMRVCFPH